MLAALSALLRSRPFVALALSLALHLLLVGAGLLGLSGRGVYTPRRGDTLFVELPEPREPAPRGTPSASRPGPPTPRPAPAPQRPRPRPETVPSAPRPQARAAPAPVPAPPPSRIARATPEPTPPTATPEPTPAPEPARPPAPEPSRTTAPEPVRRPAPVPTAPPPVVAPRSGGGEPGPRVAAVPPGPQAPPGPPVPQYDLRSGLGGRGGGAGGRSEGRGGIEGEPIPLDTTDPRYSDYLEEIRRRIKSNWGFPCVRDAATRACDYKSAQLVIEFGIAKDGRVPFVQVVRSTGFAIMDDYAVNAIKLSSPFPPIPDEFSPKGVPILATFNYVVDTSLVNLLR